MRVLCLDIEGGFGGSSRSLYEAIRNMDRERVQVEVWCRKEGPIQDKYRAIGIPTRVMPLMPRMSALPRLSRNLWQGLTALRDWNRAGAVFKELRMVAPKFDLIHLNHEALFLLGRWLHRTAKTPITVHVRTMIPPGIFGRFQARALFAATKGRVYITANERARWHDYARRGNINPQTDIVIHNTAAFIATTPYPEMPQDARLKIGSLSNCAWIRGTDRFLDIAAALMSRGVKNVLFVMAGNDALKGRWPGAPDLEAIAAKNGTLREAARLRGLSDYFLFLGHVKEPERVLAGVDLVIKPNRDNSPWGRDILEAMAAGRPVVSIGQDNTFVETGVTGVLLAQFDADKIASHLLQFENDRSYLSALGNNARERVRTLCDGSARAADLMVFWQKFADAKIENAPSWAPVRA